MSIVVVNFFKKQIRVSRETKDQKVVIRELHKIRAETGRFEAVKEDVQTQTESTALIEHEVNTGSPPSLATMEISELKSQNQSEVAENQYKVIHMNRTKLSLSTLLKMTLRIRITGRESGKLSVFSL